jgi:phosphodiesterase/alkaline phosphatase D-like protein
MGTTAVRTTRRTIVAGAGAVAAGLALSTPVHARLLTGTRDVGPGAFLDGVASGEPAQDAVTFWGRITTDRPRTAARLIVSSDPDLRTIVATVLVPTSSGVDHTLKARVPGLRPDTHYWYVWQSRDGMSPIGRTKTAPDPQSAKEVAVGYSSCQRLTAGFFNAHKDAAAYDLDLYAFLGDYTYEYAATRDSGGAADELTTNDITSYRAKLRFYRSDPHLRELHRLHPTVHVWDDHEVADNYTDGEPAPSALQRAAGYRASFEWHPRLSVPGDRYRLYRNWRLGKNAEMFMLDQRQYRTAPAPGDAFLGRPQLDWVKRGLSGSDASWKLIGNPAMIALLGLNGPLGGATFNADQWDGYVAERNELLGHIGAGIDDVSFLTGDIHIFFANQLTVDGTTTGRQVATEFVGGSVTSSGVPEAIELLGNTAIQAINPQFRYVQGARHGWSVLRADAKRMQVDYRASDITKQGDACETIARFVQLRGENRFTQAAGVLGGDQRVTRAGETAERPAKAGTPLAQRRVAEGRIATAGPARRARLAEQQATVRTKHDDRTRDRRRAA